MILEEHISKIAYQQLVERIGGLRFMSTIPKLDEVRLSYQNALKNNDKRYSIL